MSLVPDPAPLPPLLPGSGRENGLRPAAPALDPRQGPGGNPCLGRGGQERLRGAECHRAPANHQRRVRHGLCQVALAPGFHSAAGVRLGPGLREREGDAHHWGSEGRLQVSNTLSPNMENSTKVAILSFNLRRTVDLGYRFRYPTIKKACEEFAPLVYQDTDADLQ